MLFGLMLIMLVGCGQQNTNMPTTVQNGPSQMGDTALSNDKQTVTIAIPAIDENMDIESSISGELYDIITKYNNQSNLYQIVPVMYTSETALQLMISSKAVDIINWGDSILQQSDGPNAQIYAAKGYLIDLESLSKYNVINGSELLDVIVDLEKDTYGGLYTLPLSFYGRTLIGKTKYVGYQSGWTLSDVINVSKKLPEDMVLYSAITKSQFLELMLDCIINDFVDLKAKTIDFHNSEFYELLELCNNCFSGKLSDDMYSTEALLYVAPLQECAGIFGESVLATADESGICAIGYPLREGAKGNGVNLVFVNELSICSNSEHLEGTIDFLSYAFSTEIQKSNFMFSPVQSIFEDREKEYLSKSSTCTKELSDEAVGYIYNASSIAMRRSPISMIVLEEAEAFFNGDKTVEEVADIIQSRSEIFLNEQY